MNNCGLSAVGVSQCLSASVCMCYRAHELDPYDHLAAFHVALQLAILRQVCTFILVSLRGGNLPRIGGFPRNLFGFPRFPNSVSADMKNRVGKSRRSFIRKVSQL